MVPEDGFIVQIEIIVADFLPSHTAFSQTVVKRGIQMIIHAVDADNVPGMAVFDAFFRIIAANCDHTPDPKGIAKDLYCFGDSLTDSYPLSKRTNDLMGISLF